MTSKIAHFGTFDVDNFGDLLFPYILDWRLVGWPVVHISPTGRKPIFFDAKVTISSEQAASIPFSAVIVGGGNIVHARKAGVDIYLSMAHYAYASLSLGAALVAKNNDAPLIMNGPSFPTFRLTSIERYLYAEVAEILNYAALRDEKSFRLIECLGASNSALIPDTAWDISRMWPADGVDIPVAPLESDYVVVHVNSRYGGCPVLVASALDRFKEVYQKEIFLLPIGPCHGDLEYALKISSLMSSEAKVEMEFSLKKYAGLISGSFMYIGSSMHGFIVAMSYGVPGMLVLQNDLMNKFEGLLDLVGAGREVVALSWSEIVFSEKRAWLLSCERRREIFEMLDSHWKQIDGVLKEDLKVSEGKGFALNFWRILIRVSQVQAMIIMLPRKLLSRIRRLTR